MKNIIKSFLLGVLVIACDAPKQNNECCEKVHSNVNDNENFLEWAKTPPMGWNSFDAYDCRITEEEFKANVDFMAENLKDHGWEYAVIDYIWWHPKPGSWDNPNKRLGHPDIRFKSSLGEPLFPDYTRMDEYGRLIPAVERFPSSEGGKGFKPIADYVHSKGLKFGIHIMRGIHRAAYFYNKPILGTSFTAREIGEPWDTVGWCNHMFGVDHTKNGAQEYYNSLFNLYAEWEVDFVKADDMMVPPYHKEEIEMMRKAIDQCGRPMVLSLSCGEAPRSFANHVKSQANMWRISIDFWDNWESLKHNFDLFEAWSSHIGIGHYPDGDMIPFGKLSLGGRPHGPERQTGFTWEEHKTLMSLWCIARSPLFLGSDLLSMDAKTLSYLTNDEVLAVDQASTGNRCVYRKDFGVGGAAVWVADIPDSDDLYFALFNMEDSAQYVEFNFEFEYLREKYVVRDLWDHKDLGVFQKAFGTTLPAHGAGLYRLSLAN